MVAISPTTKPRVYLGAQKPAPIDMRKDEYQFIIDGYLIDEVLKQIPAPVKIIQAYVHLIQRGSEHRIAVPNVLKRLGVTSIRTHESGKMVSMIFDAISKHSLQQNVSKACKALNTPYDKAYFQYIVLGNAEASGKFMHCTKEVRPDETDQRKKLRVLGLVSGVGKVQGLVAELGAKKFHCSIKEQTIKVVMCSRN